MDVNTYSIDPGFKHVSNNQFYIPTEVQGKPGVNSLTGAKLDAHQAINDY